MSNRFPVVLPLTLTYEGGYANRNPAADPGGATLNGVTQKTYDGYRMTHALAPRDVRSMTTVERDAIYHDDYWDQIMGDDLPVGLDRVVFDFAVHSGPERAIKVLQGLLKTPQDGILGSQSRALISQLEDIHEFVQEYSDARLSFLKRLKNWKANHNGWTSRVTGMEDYAVHEVLAAQEPATHPLADTFTQPLVIAGCDKADPEDLRTLNTGPGLAILGTSATAAVPVVQGVADQVKPYVGDGLLGHIALTIVIVAAILGGAVTGYALLKPYLKK